MSDQDYFNFLRETQQTWQHITTRQAGCTFSNEGAQRLILFQQTDLTGADLCNLEMPGGFFCRQLQGVDLSGANLRGAKLIDCKLQGADLCSASLQGATLQGAQMQGATLQRAGLQGPESRGKAGSVDPMSSFVQNQVTIEPVDLNCPMVTIRGYKTDAIP